MSLKALHLLFLAGTALGACVVGAWWTATALQGEDSLLLGLSAFVFGIALIVYGVGFYARSGELPWI